MKKDGYYSSGEFAKMADVTLRTIRYYDRQNLLKPSYVNEHGARFYTDSDFVKLQQILLFKFLGFSLSEIRDMTLNHPDRHVLLDSLDIQLKLVKDRREQLQLMEQTIQTTADTIRQKKEVDWKQMMDLIHMTSMEKSLKNQYLDASNINARIHLHELYSTNKKGWFPWIFEQPMRINFPAGFQLLLPTFQRECSATPEEILNHVPTDILPMLWQMPPTCLLQTAGLTSYLPTMCYFISTIQWMH